MWIWLVSPSERMSRRCSSKAERSVPSAVCTRSLMSIAMEVKPVDDRWISWWSGTGRRLLNSGREGGEGMS